MHYRIMQLSDYAAMISLWQSVTGVKLRDADSVEGIAKYLARNPALSFVAEMKGDIVGTIMAGHDGKRGYIQHLAVAPICRNKGVATKLVTLCLAALKIEGIIKSHIHVLGDNELARDYWKNRGWVQRTDIEVFSFINGNNANV